MNKNKIFYWITLAGILLLAIILEFFPQIDGIFDNNGIMAFYTLYGMIALSLGLVYLALKLIRKNPVLRIAMLEAPMGLNLLCYHLFITPSFFYLFVILLLAYVFVYPAKTDDENQQ